LTFLINEQTLPSELYVPSRIRAMGQGEADLDGGGPGRGILAVHGIEVDSLAECGGSWQGSLEIGFRGSKEAS
jgi:hypothetical protein